MGLSFFLNEVVGKMKPRVIPTITLHLYPIASVCQMFLVSHLPG